MSGKLSGGADPAGLGAWLWVAERRAPHPSSIKWASIVPLSAVGFERCRVFFFLKNYSLIFIF